MRNILVLPDGTEIPFMYPQDHEIEIGYEFTITLKDDTVLKKPIHAIQKHDTKPEIRYYIH